MVRAGWKVNAAGQRRQRWWCTPKSGARHRFTETLPRIVSPGEERHACPECATELNAWEGQPAPRLYGFTARHVAGALAQVAAGSSYRAAAAAVRSQAGRQLDLRPRRVVTPAGKTRHLPAANQHGQLVSDWVETFAPVLWAAQAPREWPTRVVLDDTEFRYRTPGAGPRGAQAFNVLGALGYDRLGRSYIVGLEAVPRLNTAAWTRFLRSLPGEPERVVADGGIPIKAAIATWPNVEARRCEWHLTRNLLKNLPSNVRENPDDPLKALLGRAQGSVEGWEAYLDALNVRASAKRGWAAAVKAANLNDQLIRHQAATRPPVGPHSTGPLEEHFRHLKSVIGDRAARMTNKRRADALLLLLAMRRNGWADELRWAEVIRAYLVDRRGVAPLQRRHTDRATHPSLRP